MTKAASLCVVASLGVLAAFDPPFTHADPPVGQPATVYVTQTRTVARRIEGKPVGWWRSRAVANRRALNAGVVHQRALTRRLHAQTSAVRRASRPSVREALQLARAVYGIDLTRRATCESGLNPYAVEGHGPVGLLQFQPSTFASTPFGGFSIWDPVAQALAGGWMVRAGRSSEWSCRL